MSSQPIWYHGVCDRLLEKVRHWLENYDAGEVYATRPFLDIDGVKDVVTIRKHILLLRPEEAYHLARIVNHFYPGLNLARDVSRIYQNLNRCKVVEYGLRAVPVAFYREDVEKILKALEQARSGKPDVTEEFDQIGPSSGPLWK